MLSDKGYSSGGYISDIKVSGAINSGTQQQYFARNVEMASWGGDGVNMVFVGSTNAPETHCGADGGLPRTTIAATPLIAEKPYITLEGEKFKLNVPKVEA